MARALFLAGRAVDRPVWRCTTRDSLTAAARDTTTMADCGLCHGWAGLLHGARLRRTGASGPAARAGRSRPGLLRPDRAVRLPRRRRRRTTRPGTRGG
ncbi:hypothetical protein KZQ38_30775 [Saccharothrix sp. SC076]|nr:hypothetical protein [Saccharothrix obliqua]